MDCASYPAVLKADGLAAGKGVVIAASPREAKQALRECFVERRFGEAGSRVLVEEFLEGEELSLLALCDGERAVPMAPAQDFKRIGDGRHRPEHRWDGELLAGPGIDSERAAEITGAVHQPILDTLRARGIRYRGVLYAGLMMTSAGAKVLEFNCRFGDPETQAVLPRLRSDLLDALEACLEPGGLDRVTLDWSDDWAVTVVMASAGYPVSSQQRRRDHGPRRRRDDVEITHAGTARRDGALVTAGGRVLNVTGLGPSLEDARGRAFAAVERIHFDGAQYRPDIAARVAERVGS